MLSEHRNKHAARRFPRRLVEVAGSKPLRVTTDAHPPYRRAIRWILGRKVRHRRSQYLNNLTEQDLSCGEAAVLPDAWLRAVRFRAAFDELRQYCRVRQRRGEYLPLRQQPWLFVTRWHSLISELAAA